MLPFLKNRDDGVGVGPAETKRRDPDDGDKAEYGIIDAIAEDMKAGRFKEAVQALCDYLKSEDMEQDQSLMGD